MAEVAALASRAISAIKKKHEPQARVFSSKGTSMAAVVTTAEYPFNKPGKTAIFYSLGL
jgi:hypothetical protein